MSRNKSPKEQLFSKVSHDLRGSFTSILGFSDILNDPNENLSSEEISEFVKRIGTQSKDSFNLLVNFINWLKLDSFNYGIVKEKIDLTEMTLNIQSLNRRKLTWKEIDINNLLNNSIYVLADYEILNTIISNLFSYLIEVTNVKSSISIRPIENEANFSGLSFVCNTDNNLDYLNNILEINSDIPYSILFAHEFAKLSGGNLDIIKDEKNLLKISLLLPSTK